MAAVVLGVSTPSTSNASSYASGSFTPAADDLLVVFVAKTASVNNGTMSDSLGGAWTLIQFAQKASSADRLVAFVRNALAPASAMTVTYDCTGDAATGAVVTVLRVSGMSRVGAAALRQSAFQDNQAASTTPAPAFGAACLTGNPTLGCVFNATNPATLTPPTSWTERNDTGYGTPNTGSESVSRDSGFTGTTITWGGTSASAFGSLAVELDASASTTFTQALAATALGVAALAPVATYPRTLAATAIGVPALAKVATYLKTLAATALGVPALAKGMFATLAATAVAVPAVTKGLFKTLAATATGVASLASALLSTVSMAAVATGAAVIQARAVFVKALAATAVAAASLAALFIAGSGGAALAVRRAAIWLGRRLGI